MFLCALSWLLTLWYPLHVSQGSEQSERVLSEIELSPLNLLTVLLGSAWRVLA